MKYFEVFRKLTDSFQKYQIERVAPLVEARFGTDFIGRRGSDIAACLLTRARGRPRPSDDDGCFFPPSRPQSLRVLAPHLPEDGVAMCLHLVARDSVDGKLYVFVEWPDHFSTRTTWVSWSSLSEQIKRWLQWNLEYRLPRCDIISNAPQMRCTGGPVVVIFDDDSDGFIQEA